MLPPATERARRFTEKPAIFTECDNGHFVVFPPNASPNLFDMVCCPVCCSTFEAVGLRRGLVSGIDVELGYSLAEPGGCEPETWVWAH